jgi:predicted phage terminase large subunit-like protein
MLMTLEEYAYVLRHDLMSFIERSFQELNPRTRLLPARYIEAIAAKLETCHRGEIRRLIINLPPRYLKSHCASIAFVAWYLGHHPAGQVICASYGQDLADKLARDCRTIMMSRWYQALFPARLADRLAVRDFTTTDRGFRMSTSVGGVLTGRGADLILIDDPLKPDDALSRSQRTAVNEWYDNTLLSRLNDKTNGCIVIIMQRLHQDDLVSHVLGQENWEVLSFPAIAEEDETFVIDSALGRTVFHRRAGDALHPERESLYSLEKTRASIGGYNFSSQYQQNPVPLGGAMVKTEWLRFYEPAEKPESFNQILQSWDTANKTAELNDYSVCTTWGVHGRTYYLLDVYRARLSYPDLRRMVEELASRHDTGTILIEDKASGTQLIQELERALFGVKAYKPPSGADSTMRLHAQTIAFENGSVFLPKTAPWLDDYVNEIIGFPGTKHDDQVDSTTQALDYLRQHDRLGVWERLVE